MAWGPKAVPISFWAVLIPVSTAVTLAPTVGREPQFVSGLAFRSYKIPKSAEKLGTPRATKMFIGLTFPNGSRLSRSASPQ